MKTSKKGTPKAVEALAKIKVDANKSTCRTRRQHPKLTAGQSEDPLAKMYMPSSPSGSPEALCLQNVITTANRLPTAQIYPDHILRSSRKIKLQLFPVDERTRIGLEQDGYHPYLELTLSTNKKISSVLKHLNEKWGASSIALGEPILFPYKMSEDLASYRWTLDDTDTSTGDVYADIGNPSIFRLRYGWFLNSETKTLGMSSASTPFDACLQHDDIQKGCSGNEEGKYNEGKPVEVLSEELKPIAAGQAMDALVANKLPSIGVVESQGNEARTEDGIGPSLVLWDDSLTNISIGGLLSEASLQGRFNNCDPKSNASNAGLQPSCLISESFDAFLASQVNQSQGSKLPPLGSRSSILDAEDTCHAFSFQKIFSSSNDAQTLGGSGGSQTCGQQAGSKTFKLPNMTEVNSQSGLPLNHNRQESDTDLSLRSRVYDDGNSLGLSGIKWTDSLGPFDLGLSSSANIVNGDSLNIGRIV